MAAEKSDIVTEGKYKGLLWCEIPDKDYPRWAKSKGYTVPEPDAPMTFGKHKGVMWSNVPSSYKSWMEENEMETPIGNPIMTFGRYKNVKWRKVCDSYKTWMADNDVQPPLGIEKAKAYPILGVVEKGYQGNCDLCNLPSAFEHRKKCEIYFHECRYENDEDYS